MTGILHIDLHPIVDNKRFHGNQRVFYNGINSVIILMGANHVDIPGRMAVINESGLCGISGVSGDHSRGLRRHLLLATDVIWPMVTLAILDGMTARELFY